MSFGQTWGSALLETDESDLGSRPTALPRSFACGVSRPLRRGTPFSCKGGGKTLWSKALWSERPSSTTLAKNGKRRADGFTLHYVSGAKPGVDVPKPTSAIGTLSLLPELTATRRLCARRSDSVVVVRARADLLRGPIPFTWVAGGSRIRAPRATICRQSSGGVTST